MRVVLPKVQLGSVKEMGSIVCNWFRLTVVSVKLESVWG